MGGRKRGDDLMLRAGDLKHSLVQLLFLKIQCQQEDVENVENISDE